MRHTIAWARTREVVVCTELNAQKSADMGNANGMRTLFSYLLVRYHWYRVIVPDYGAN